MRSDRSTLVAVVVAVLLFLPSGSRAAPDVLAIERKITLGEVRGRIDHLAVDLARGRLFVAELGNGSLGVVDLDHGKLVRRIDGIAEPQGVAYSTANDTVYVATGGDGALLRFKGDNLAQIGMTELGDDADNIRIDARGGRIVVGYAEGALALLDSNSGAVTGKIPLEGHPESSSSRPTGAVSSSTCRQPGRLQWLIETWGGRWRPGTSMAKLTSRWPSTKRIAVS